MSIGETLDQAIRAILESPETNLNRISMRTVREQLPYVNRSLSNKWIKENMDFVDRRIVDMYEQVNASPDS